MTETLPIIHPTAVSGFWIRSVGDETRIGAVHRSPRVIGAIFGVAIWMIVFWQPFANLGNPSLYDVGASLLGVIIGVAFRRHLFDLMFGRTEVRIRRDSAVIVRGIGILDELEPFGPARVTAVGGYDTSDGRTCTTLEGLHPIHLGINWTEPRREAMARALSVHLGVPLLKVRSVFEQQQEATATAAVHPDASPPSGTWLLQDGDATRIGASCRSLAAIPVAIFALIWNGTIFFVAWLTIFGGKPQFLPLLALHALFGFVLGWAALHACIGHIEVRLTGDHAELYEGIGRFRKPRRFAVTDVRGVRETTRHGTRSSSTFAVIDVDKPIEFGASLSPARRRWLVVQLYRRLIHSENRPVVGAAGAGTPPPLL